MTLLASVQTSWDLQVVPLRNRAQCKIEDELSLPAGTSDGDSFSLSKLAESLSVKIFESFFFLAERDESIIRRSLTVKALNICSVKDFSCGKFCFKMAISSSLSVLFAIFGILYLGFLFDGGGSSSSSEDSDPLPEDDSKMSVFRSLPLSALAAPEGIREF